MKLHQQKMTIDMEMETITDIRNIEIIDMKTCMDMKTDMVETRTCCDHFPTSLQGHRTVSSLGLDFINIITKSKPPGREGNRLINIVLLGVNFVIHFHVMSISLFMSMFSFHVDVHFTAYVHVYVHMIVLSMSMPMSMSLLKPLFISCICWCILGFENCKDY